MGQGRAVISPGGNPRQEVEFSRGFFTGLPTRLWTGAQGLGWDFPSLLWEPGRSSFIVN